MGAGVQSEAAFKHELRAVPREPYELEEFCDHVYTVSDGIKLATAETFFEAGILSNDPDQILRCNDKAVQAINGIIGKNTSFDVQSPELLRAQVLRAYAPFYGMLSLTGRLPNPTVNHKIEGALTEVMRPMVNNWDKWLDGMKKRGFNPAGSLAELFGLGLLQRYVTANVTDRHWGVAPALFSERQGFGGGRLNTNWHITCFEQEEGEARPRIAQKIRIKASQKALDMDAGIPSPDDIKAVPFTEAVLTDHRGSVWGYRQSMQVFLGDYDSAEGRNFDGRRVLERATEKLLTIVEG